LALEPDEILILANRTSSASLRLAKTYSTIRNVPQSNILELRVANTESISREDYDRHIAAEVRQFLEANFPVPKIRCILTLYGIPLKILPPALKTEEKAKILELGNKKQSLVQLIESDGEISTKQTEMVNKEIKELERQIKLIRKNDYRASVDSELTLVRHVKYPLHGWIRNPFFVGFKDKKLKFSPEDILMVSRLDAASDDIVERIIRESIEAEKRGLNGTAYFDARWEAPQNFPKGVYAFYDNSIHKAAAYLKTNTNMPVIVDDKRELFQPGQCPEAMLYCGWYSLARYVDAFQWRTGAVGYHIASSECSTLTNKDSRVWCKKMLEEGVAVTIGPTSEPYLRAFTVPEIFFTALVQGRMTVAECYMFSTPFLSWQMVLIGDPLYTPFKNR
jgi:uncharacterized protein (TIGR03790 family)